MTLSSSIAERANRSCGWPRPESLVESVKPRQTAVLAGRQDAQVAESELNRESWDFSGEPTQNLLHNLHPYPARFIPQIPRRCIERWSEPGDLILDPFCGSGTSLLEAKLTGRDSIGVDNNGVATLVATAKILNYRERDFEALVALAREINCTLDEASPAMLGSLARSLPDAPAYAGIEKWFDPVAVNELRWMRCQLESLPENARCLGMAVFSSLVVRASRQDSDTRYVATSRAYTPNYAVRTWTTRIPNVVARAKETVAQSRPSSHTVLTQDSRQLGSVRDGSVALIVTSPPYLNAYDYHKYHRHRLHWIRADIPLARDVEIGKHDTFTRRGATPGAYLRDLTVCLREWSRVLVPRGRAVVVVGDAIVSGEFVPVGDTLVELAGRAGLQLEARWLRNLDRARKSFNRQARIKREHVLLFRKSE